MGVYPFMFGSVQDFEPIVQELVQVWKDLELVCQKAIHG